MTFQNKTIAMLGGGQLGRMMLQEAPDLNLDIMVLDPDPQAPCKNLCEQFHHGSLQDLNTVLDFAKSAHIVTIEIEHVNVEALKVLEQAGKQVYPQPHILEMIQDKGLQKQFYLDHGIPSPAFVLLKNKTELEQHIPFLPAFNKVRKGGYDGKGVVKINSVADKDKVFEAPSLLEKFVDFEKEISVIVARNENGEIVTYPCVECLFNPEANLVEFLISPAQISNNIEQQAQTIAKKIAAQLKIVGILAVEMFVTKQGEVLVNEIAPRPHNSGHQSIEGNATSQFAQHLKAILNLPLGDTSITEPSVMINLLGEKGHEGPVHYEGLEAALALGKVYPHIYGKAITKPFRKMGHITVTDKTIEKAIEKAKQVKGLVRCVTNVKI
jgi:5-(carboxyamino)imidazole ribonucleotide synthase